MRMISLIFLVLPFFSSSQRNEHVKAFQKSIPSGLGNAIRMPDPGYISDFLPKGIADYRVKQRVWVVNTDSVYRKIFRQYRYTMDSVRKYAPDTSSHLYRWMLAHLRDSLPVIDFEKQDLLVYSACGQCLAFCHHDDYGSCHRNACLYMHEWFLRERQVDIVKEDSGWN